MCVAMHTHYTVHVDQGTEFINNDLKNWCQEKGMEIELTALYPPLQNRVAEQMNRTLIKLTHCEELTTNEEFLRWGRCNLGAEGGNRWRIRREQRGGQ